MLNEGAALNWVSPTPLLTAIVNPPQAQPELDIGQDDDDDEEEPGHGRGVAHLEIVEGVAVEVEHVEEG